MRYLRSIYVPEDETCFHLFESPSIEGVEEVGRRAGLVFNRITEAVEPVITEGASPGTVAAPLVEMAVSTARDAPQKEEDG